MASPLAEILALYPWRRAPQAKVSLAPFTSFHCQAVADFHLCLENREELVAFLKLARAYKIPWLVLGRGSNTLFTEAGLKGVLVQLKGEFKQLVRLEGEKVWVGAGLLNRQLCLGLQKEQLSGAEFLSTIPGTIGGSVTMNAGAFGQEIESLVQEVEASRTDGQVIKLPKSDCHFTYRHSVFQKHPWIITGAVLHLKAGDRSAIAAKEKVFQQQRRATQPVLAATWGSVFKNPPAGTGKAGQLIESCGLKGRVFGGLRISPIHANFIENVNHATFQDITEALCTILNQVWAKFGIRLELEVKIYTPTAELMSIEALLKGTPFLTGSGP